MPCRNMAMRSIPNYGAMHSINAQLMIRHMDKKRAALKLKPMMYEQPFAVEA